MPDPPQDVSQKTVSSRGGDHSGLGQWGERKAAEYLQGQGYRLLDTRFRCREGEIDLILVREPYLCFVEVKLRKDADLAQARFDVVEVYAPQGVETVLPTIYHLENAF